MSTVKIKAFSIVDDHAEENEAWANSFIGKHLKPVGREWERPPTIDTTYFDVELQIGDILIGLDSIQVTQEDGDEHWVIDEMEWGIWKRVEERYKQKARLTIKCNDGEKVIIDYASIQHGSVTGHGDSGKVVTEVHILKY